MGGREGGGRGVRGGREWGKEERKKKKKKKKTVDFKDLWVSWSFPITELFRADFMEKAPILFFLFVLIWFG